MSILNPPEGILLVIQRRLRDSDCVGEMINHASADRVWLDCSNVNAKGYRADQSSQCLIDLQEMAQRYPRYDYRVMSTVTYEPPRKAALKGF